MIDGLVREHAQALKAVQRGVPGAIEGVLNTDADLSAAMYANHPETLQRRLRTLRKVAGIE